MRRSRKKKPDKPLIPRYNLNERIKAPELRLIDDEGNNIGVLSIKDAIAKAKEMEMDLVEINPKANPPIAKITEFKHFKYQKEKEARKQKQNSKTSEMKGIRLSIRIGQHDIDIRRDRALKFLSRGDKVRIEIILRGRERAKTQIANEVINAFVETIKAETAVRYDQEVLRQGNKVTAIIAKQ
jgi:translation initiation factor IF-3